MEFKTIRRIKNGHLHIRKLFIPRPGAKPRVVYDVAIPGYYEFIPKPDKPRPTQPVVQAINRRPK